MPYGPDSEQPSKPPLTDAEREQRIKEIQREQERRLRETIGDELFDWLQDFEDDGDVLCQD